jgi:hypothetical protein
MGSFKVPASIHGISVAALLSLRSLVLRSQWRLSGWRSTYSDPFEAGKLYELSNPLDVTPTLSRTPAQNAQLSQMA